MAAFVVGAPAFVCSERARDQLRMPRCFVVHHISRRSGISCRRLRNAYHTHTTTDCHHDAAADALHTSCVYREYTAGYECVMFVWGKRGNEDRTYANELRYYTAIMRKQMHSILRSHASRRVYMEMSVFDVLVEFVFMRIYCDCGGGVAVAFCVQRPAFCVELCQPCPCVHDRFALHSSGPSINVPLRCVFCLCVQNISGRVMCSFQRE